MFVLLTILVYYSFFEIIKSQFIELTLIFLKEVGLKLNKSVSYGGIVRVFGQVDCGTWYIRHVRPALEKWVRQTPGILRTIRSIRLRLMERMCFDQTCCMALPAFQAALFLQQVWLDECSFLAWLDLKQLENLGNACIVRNKN